MDKKLFFVVISIAGVLLLNVVLCCVIAIDYSESVKRWGDGAIARMFFFIFYFFFFFFIFFIGIEYEFFNVNF